MNDTDTFVQSQHTFSFAVMVRLSRNAKLIELKGGPHGVLWTYAEGINAQLVDFLA